MCQTWRFLKIDANARCPLISTVEIESAGSYERDTCNAVGTERLAIDGNAVRDSGINRE